MSFRCNSVNLGRFTEEKCITVKCRTPGTTQNNQKSLAQNTKAQGRQNMWQMYIKLQVESINFKNLLFLIKNMKLQHPIQNQKVLKVKSTYAVLKTSQKLGCEAYFCGRMPKI